MEAQLNELGGRTRVRAVRAHVGERSQAPTSRLRTPSRPPASRWTRSCGPRWTALLPRGYEAKTILADGTVLFKRSFPRATS